MKVVCVTDGDLRGIFPADIRRYVGKIVSEDRKDDVLWHKKAPPKLIYARPGKTTFEIVNYDGDGDLIAHVAESLLENPSINLNGRKTAVKSVFLKEEEYPVPRRGFYFYRTRTPIILSSNPVEFKMVYAAANGGGLAEMLKRRIRHDVSHKLKHYLGIDFDFDGLTVYPKSINLRLVEYKKGEKKRQAVFAEFACNYSLSRFVGYKNGFGWGELKEADPFSVQGVAI